MRRVRRSETIARLEPSPSTDWVVVDGYQFTLDDYHRFKTAARWMLVLDDRGAHPSLPADLILNQNIYAGPELYSSLATSGSSCWGPIAPCCDVNILTRPRRQGVRVATFGTSWLPSVRVTHRE